MPLDAQPNPLLDFSDHARFDAILPVHITPAIDTLLAACRRAVEQVTDRSIEADWASVVEPLDDATEHLSRAWGAVAHMNAVVDTPALRDQYNANLPKLTAFWTELSQDERLYARYKALAARSDFDRWPAARRKVVDNELRDFRLGGAELDAAGKQRLRQVRERLAQLTTRFAENVLDATNAFALYLSEKESAQLDGVPADARAMYREAADAEGGVRTGSYKITLQYPSYAPVINYAHDRTLRERMYRAYVTRASEFGKPEWDNGTRIVEILRLRREQATLLGHASFAELSLVPKMARSPREVTDFLRDLARRARPHAEHDMAQLREFAARDLDLPDLQAWDIGYASERLREARYAYSEQELKQYFPEPRVIEGLFRVIETLFAVRITPDRAPVWHPEARFYRISAASDGTLVGQFYLDLYARDHKQGGAWQDDARARRRLGRDAATQTPVSFLTCNFPRPVGGKPALFTHDDVLTLFHEFGHGLHHLLTRVDEMSVAGIRGVEWDAVELPSQFMENFAWEWDVLQQLSAHVDTGARLPRPLYDKMIAARNFQTGMQTLRQVEFALLDMRLHGEFDPDRATPADVLRLVDDVRREVAVVHPPAWNRMIAAFTHIFAGGYAAGYYSYKWAEVLSADAYAAFEEAAQAATSGSTLDPAVGQRFRDSILAVGGSRPALESFTEFRGRAPTIDALLRHHGMS
jgi:oligopeptidase A